MKKMKLSFYGVLTLLILVSCLEANKSITSNKCEKTHSTLENPTEEPHNYGGWYCPDNLSSFPAVDFSNWKNTPVIKGRLATEEEVKNGQSLILVDLNKYPKTKALEIELPQLAKHYNYNSQREEIIIIIQAIQVLNDSLVGFRYLNGGNGSARIDEVEFLDQKAIEEIPNARFVSEAIEIKAKPTQIWSVLTDPVHADELQSAFEYNKRAMNNWRNETNVNYYYRDRQDRTADYAEMLFGNYYIQNDYEQLNYTEKFMLVEDESNGTTTLKITCGPYLTDFETQKNILKNWALQVKQLSEAKN